MINLKKYVLSIVYKVKYSPICDLEFWDDLKIIDIEEECLDV